MADVDGADAWIEIGVEVDYEAVEPVVELFSRYGYRGGVAIEEPFTQDPDGDNLAVDITRPFTVRAFLPAMQMSPAIREEIEHALWHLSVMRPVGGLTLREHREQDWEEAWKQHFAPVRASAQVTIRPPWIEVDEQDGAWVVTLDPGMAFGTGTHPTTRLCLELLETLPLEGTTVLDAGTGTGVLAIAAAMMGAARVDAVDVDPVAVRQATANVNLNGVSDRIRVWEDGLATSPSTAGYDVVIANIIARILAELHPTLISSLKPGGTLLLSGIIEDKEPLVDDCYRRAGMVREERRQMGDWIAHRWHRPANTT
jgi:ribosomal protein L11 methyltransferase